ncbi:MAG: glutathione S-transferase N-terminal domain-containing protein [Pseudomonadota bacterium]|nr:glutathione S-transferase N-terminal domain-containing protein [Pseudomonadota bacterium]
MKLIKAKPSPFGRKVIIALHEKAVPFEIAWDIPWHEDTCVGNWNPLQQLPILIADSGEVVYESSYILEWLEARFPSPPLIPPHIEDRLLMGRFRVLAVGVMDAIVRINFELARPADQHSQNWLRRHKRKIVGGISEIGRLIDGRRFAVGGALSHADLEVGSVLGHLDFLVENIPPLSEALLGAGGWRGLHPCLADYVAGLEARSSFQKATREMVQIDFQAVVG